MRLLNSSVSHRVMAPMPQGDSFDHFPLQVLISDSQTARSQLIQRIALEGGVHAVQPFDHTALGKLKLSTPFCFALVALDECPVLESPVLDLVRAIVKKGVVVVCYADHAQRWAIAKRCNVLLAGAFTLFDSSEAKFALELKRTMIELLRWAKGRADEQETTKREMRQVGIVGESKVMCSIFGWIKRVSALSDLPALITGETGTGKGLIVKAIHQLDPKRSPRPF